ncbi:iron-containing alcohol dehydrogenase [Zhongshania borealis]|uniref:Ethanolamine utilization ethanol dehydrogenase EutG n=1 Tax=Zhongshania borealis TaxID=889488 RepID=A0ABP7W734_9GAMM
MTIIQSSVNEEVIASIVTQTVDELTPHNLFNFCAPRQTLVGEGAILKIGSLLKGLSVRHVLIVVDNVVYQKGLLRSAQRSLERAGIEFSVFSGIEREPGTDIVQQGVAQLKQTNADFVLGFGGGSALDAAKVIAMLGSCNCSLEEFFSPNFNERRSVGLGAVPTTAGTGSEVTDISVILKPDRQKKFVTKHVDLMPDLAVVDPGLMLNLPASVTAATGIDALTHAIEAFTARNANPLSKALAISAIQKLVHALPIVVGDGENKQARLDMAIGAYEAGLAFSNAGLGLVHAISHQVGARYEIAHGVANGILLPFVMVFNGLVCRSEYAAIAHVFGIAREAMTERQRCDAGVIAVRQLLTDIGLPGGLAEAGARPEHFSEIAEAALQDICIVDNPRSVTKADIITLLRQASDT